MSEIAHRSSMSLRGLSFKQAPCFELKKNSYRDFFLENLIDLLEKFGNDVATAFGP